MPIRSMTGFARVSRSTPFGELTLSIKSVNHRGLDVHVHIPLEFDAVEAELRTALRKRIVRGHVQVQLFLKRVAASAGAGTINEPLLRSWLEAFQDAAKRFGIDSKPDLNQALRVPGMIDTNGPAALSGPQAAEREALDAEVRTATAAALDELDAFRVREGAAIESEIRMRSAVLRDLVRQMEEIRSRALPAFHKRLRDRLGEM